MNSSHKPPARGAASNWGRRDNIRAGAVSGPWRSSPRTPSPPEPVQTQVDDLVAPTGSQLGKPGFGEAPQKRMEPQLSADAVVPKPSVTTKPANQTSVRARIDGAPRPVRSPVRRLLPGIIGGLAAAVAIVAGAVILRDGGPTNLADGPAPVVQDSLTSGSLPGGEARAERPETPEEAGNNPVASVPADQPANLPNTAVAFESGPVRLRVGPNITQDRRNEIIQVLSEHGHGPVTVENISFNVAVSRVGYYHGEDLDAANALADRITALLREPTGKIAVRDYGNLMPEAQTGLLDLWVKG